MSKRAFEYAFSLSGPGGSLVNARSGFDAPKPQVLVESPYSPISSLRIPGHWPHDITICDSAEDHEVAPAPSTISSSIFTTFGRWAAIASIKNLLALPARLGERFWRREHLIVQPIVRDDGARKRRIVSAGLVDEPSTPSPSQKARANITRRMRRHNTATTSPDLWMSALSPGQGPVAVSNASSSDVSMSSVSADGVLEQYTSPSSPDIWISVLSPGRSPEALASTASPDIWLPTPSPARHQGLQASNTPEQDEYLEDSLDFSMNDVLSGTPLLSHVASSPAPCQMGPIAFPDLGALRTKAVDESSKFSPRTHRRIIDVAPVTPMRKKLIKNQLGLAQLAASSAQAMGDHTKPVVSDIDLPQPSPLKEQAIKSSLLSINAKTYADECRAKAKAQEEQEAERQALHQAEVNAHFNYRETVDRDLSFLSDAPDADEEHHEEERDRSDMTLYSPSPLPLRKKAVRWSQHANAKPFYFDEKVSDMLDSTLETILSSPIRVREEIEFEESDDSEEGPSDVDGQEISYLSDSKDSAADASAQLVGFTGVPPETWEDSDDSLEESQISLELLEELQQDLQKKLALAPPSPVPAPTVVPTPVKALISPLSSEEQDKLDAAAKKTENGQLATAYVVGEKLNAHDFATLLPELFNGDPRAWLNDNIVNEYLSILVAEKKKEAGFVKIKDGPAPPLHAFSSFWYTNMKDNNFKKVERWAGRFQLAGKQYLDAELILYPICDKGHWRLLAVKPKDRVIEYLDSLGFVGDMYVGKMREYLAKELGKFYVADEWTVVKGQRSSEQLNGSDCGVFTVLNALALMRGEDFCRVVSCRGMSDARKRIAISLMAGATTTEFE